MLTFGDLINFIKSILKLLKTEDWEALLTVVFGAGLLGFFLGWLFYRVLRPPRPQTEPKPRQPPEDDGVTLQLRQLEVERNNLQKQLKAAQDILDRMLSDEGE